MAEEKTKNQIVIDATNATLGRLASYAAKQALLGKKIEIVNCDLAIIAGNPKSIIAHYQKLRKRGGSSLKGPFFPKSPERVLRRTIRAMLPDHKRGRGKEAYKNIMCHNLVPPELADSKKITAGKEKKTKIITLRELANIL